MERVLFARRAQPPPHQSLVDRIESTTMYAKYIKTPKSPSPDTSSEIETSELWNFTGEWHIWSVGPNGTKVFQGQVQPLEDGQESNREILKSMLHVVSITGAVIVVYGGYDPMIIIRYEQNKPDFLRMERDEHFVSEISPCGKAHVWEGCQSNPILTCLEPQFTIRQQCALVRIMTDGVVVTSKGEGKIAFYDPNTILFESRRRSLEVGDDIGLHYEIRNESLQKWPWEKIPVQAMRVVDVEVSDEMYHSFRVIGDRFVVYWNSVIDRHNNYRYFFCKINSRKFIHLCFHIKSSISVLVMMQCENSEMEWRGNHGC